MDNALSRTCYASARRTPNEWTSLVMNEPKQVDLKALLDKIKQIASDSPELAKQMMEQFAKQSDHVREMNKLALQAEISVVFRGQIFGLVIGLTAIMCGAVVAGVGAYFGATAAQVAGGSIGGIGVIGLVSV